MSNFSLLYCISTFSSSHFVWRASFSFSALLHCSSMSLCTYAKAWVDFAVSSWAHQRRASTLLMIWCNWASSSPGSFVPIVEGTVETMWLDCSACCTSWSSPLIRLNTSSCFTSFFFVISNEVSFSAMIKKSKSYVVRIVLNVVLVTLAFFRDEGFGGVTFLFLDGSSSCLGGVTSPLFFLNSVPPHSPPSSLSGEIKAVSVEVLLTSWTSSSFLALLGPGVLDIVSGLSTLDIIARFIGTRRSFDHSLVISSKSYSINL